jgi:tetrapyrrole methylase family protein / MazG family protein
MALGSIGMNRDKHMTGTAAGGNEGRKDWLAEVVRIMARLRAEDGCPWDREQTHQSLKRYLVEETAEFLDAIDDRNDDAIRDELGDVLMQVVFHAQIAAEQGRFDIQDAARGLCEKLIRRHPHVFGQARAETPDQVVVQWDQIKRQERKTKGPDEDLPKGALHGVPRHLPALQRAQKIQDKAAKAGFDWPDAKGILDKIEEETSEVRRAMTAGDKAAAGEEIGDLLFAVAKLSRFLGHPPEEALHKTIDKFERRFRRMEQWLADQDKTMESCTLVDLEVLWQRAKSEERAPGS